MTPQDQVLLADRLASSLLQCAKLSAGDELGKTIGAEDVHKDALLTAYLVVHLLKVTYPVPQALDTALQEAEGLVKLFVGPATVC